MTLLLVYQSLLRQEVFLRSSWELSKMRPAPGTYLEELVVGHVGGESGDGLSAGAADADEQGVAAWLLQDPGHARDVLDGEPEQHQVHRLLRHLVVLVQKRLHQLHEHRSFGTKVSKARK